MRLISTPIILLIFLGFTTNVLCQVNPQFLPQITDYPKILATAIQADGKILISGEIRTIGDNLARPFMRLNADGSVDNSFQPPELPKTALISSIVIDNNGKILIGGGDGSLPIAMRLNANGTNDPSFTLTSQINQAIIRIVPLSDGSYLISSFSTKPLAKVTNSGTLDASFDIGAGPNAIGRQGDIAVQADGKIIVVDGFTTFNNVSAKGIVRLNANGSIDNTFSVGSGLSSPGWIKSIALDGDKIILAGYFSSFNSVAAQNIVRLLPTGAVDLSFTYPGPASNFFNNGIDEIKLHAGGIVLAGLRAENAKYYYALMKLKLDGSLETSFSTLQGEYSFNAGILDEPVVSISASKILFSGYFDKMGSVDRRGIVQVDENGVVINNFNPVMGGNALIKTTRVQADGKIIIGGAFNHVGDVYINNLARLNPDGGVDESFRSNLGAGFNLVVNAVEILPTGKILVGGSFYKVGDTDRTLLIRLNADGTIDPTFNTDLAIKYVGYGVNAMQVLPSGKILVGGAFYYSGNTKYNLARLLETGALDATFNSQMLSTDEIVNTIGLQTDNNLLIGGVKPSGGFMRRSTFDGVVTNSFGTIDLTEHAVKIIKVLPNDDFLMAGYPTGGVSSTTPNPLFQFGKEGNLVDKLSVAVYEGNILNIQSLGGDYLLLGTFQKVNNTPIKSFAKIKLNGSVEALFDYSVDGVIFDLTKDNLPHNSFYIIGSFYSIAQQTSYNLAKINLDMPIVPGSLAHTIDNTYGTITLGWQDKSYNETGFNIFRSEGAGFTAIDSVGQNVKTFIDFTASPLKTYTYKVGAYTLFQSLFSNEVSVSTSGWIPPATPTGLKYNFSSDFESAVLTWTDASTNEREFEIERSLNGTEFTFLNKVERDIVTYSDGINIDALHRYRLRAVNKFGASNYTATLELPIITSLEDDRMTSVTVYPNPTADKLWITKEGIGSLNVTVFDLQGRLLHQQMGTEQTTEVSLLKMPKGLYMVRVQYGSHSRTFKIDKR